MITIHNAAVSPKIKPKYTPHTRTSLMWKANLWTMSVLKPFAGQTLYLNDPIQWNQFDVKALYFMYFVFSMMRWTRIALEKGTTGGCTSEM